MDTYMNTFGFSILVVAVCAIAYLIRRGKLVPAKPENKNWRERPYKEPEGEVYEPKTPGHCIKEYEMVDGSKKYFPIIHIEKYPGFFQPFPLQNMKKIKGCDFNRHVPFESLEEAKQEIEEYLVRWRKATVSKVTIIENVKPK